jgi:hypothetical protein
MIRNNARVVALGSETAPMAHPTIRTRKPEQGTSRTKSIAGAAKKTGRRNSAPPGP